MGDLPWREPGASRLGTRQTAVKSYHGRLESLPSGEGAVGHASARRGELQFAGSPDRPDIPHGLVAEASDPAAAL